MDEKTQMNIVLIDLQNVLSAEAWETSNGLNIHGEWEMALCLPFNQDRIPYLFKSKD